MFLAGPRAGCVCHAGQDAYQQQLLQEAARRELEEARGAWEARGQRQRAELREMETRLERQEQVHGRASAALQHNMAALQQRLADSEVKATGEIRIISKPELKEETRKSYAEVLTKLGMIEVHVSRLWPARGLSFGTLELCWPMCLCNGGKTGPSMPSSTPNLILVL